MKLPPNSPSFKLENYLIKLRDNIKLVGISTILKQRHEKFKKSYKDKAKEYNVSANFYRTCILGETCCPIWFLKRIYEKDSDNNLFDVVYDKVNSFTSGVSVDFLPKVIDPRLAYYIGYLHGDGHIDKNKWRITFTDRYLNQLELISELTKLLFGHGGHIRIRPGTRGRQPMPVLDVRRITVDSFLADVIGINRGRREHNEIPLIIKNNELLLKWYLCGLFDAEGTMPLNYTKGKQMYIDIAMKDSALIKELKILLEKFDINVYGPYVRKAKSYTSGRITIEGELRIRKKLEIKKFLNIISTLHPDKIRRAKLMLNEIGP